MSNDGAPAFVGRADELDLLRRRLQDARDGHVAMVLIGGEPGIGKSTLVAEAAGRFGARSLVAPCVRMGGAQLPLAPVVSLLRRLQRTEPELLDAAALLVEWIRPGSESSLRHADVLAAVTDLLVAVTTPDAPVMFVVEDVHWADAATWDLVEHLARDLVDVPVLIAATFRTQETTSDPELRRRVAELSRLPHVSRIMLDGWSRAEVADRIEAMTGAPPSPELVAEIAARGEGNPFFTQQLVDARRSGAALPELVNDLIAADLARLDSAARAAVSALAVLGRAADHDLVAAVAGLDAEVADRAVRDAVGAGLVVADDETYQVRHALIGEVSYRSLLPGERRRHHRLAAAALGSRAPRRAQVEHRGELAVHLDRAGDIDAAFGALLAAADASEGVAPAAALEHLLRAIELWDEVGPNGDADELTARLWQAADLASATRGNDLAIELAERALGLGPPPRGWAWGHERLGRYLWSAGRIDASAVEFDRALQIVSTSNAGVEVAPVLAGLAQAELMRADYDHAEAHSRRALSLLPDPDVDRLAWVMATRILGIVVSHRGDPAVGIDLCRQSVAAAPTAHIRSLASVYLAFAQLAAGRYDAAVTSALDASADAQRSGTYRSFGGYLDALAAEGLVRLGRWMEADRLLARHPPGQTIPVGDLRLAIAGAKLAVRLGDIGRARELLAGAAAQRTDGFHETYLVAGVADVELVAGDWRAAADAARRGLSSPAGSLLLWQARFTALVTLAEVERALDARAAHEPADVDADALLADVAAVREGVAAHDAEQLAEAIAYVELADAAIGRLRGPDADAWRRVGDRWDALSDAWLTALCRLREADDAVVTGDARRAETALRTSHAIAERLGSAPLREAIAALARRARIDVEAPEVLVVEGTTIERLGLTSREAEVLGQVAAGATNREIGERLFISEKTASVHVSNILRKLGVSSRVEAAAVAQRLQLD